MFGKKKETETEVTPEEAGTFLPKGQSPRKGSPTPKRKQAEAANRRPIVADHRTLSKDEKRIRKAEERARSDEAWRKQQDAMKSGDERNMPAQHAGPVRRFARDYLDARSGLAVGFMPMALVLLASIFIQAYWPQIFVFVTLGVYGVFLLMILDSLLAVRNARQLAEEKFGENKVPPRFFWQMFTRTFYLRRWRLPAPQVKRGQYPTGGTKEDLKEARRARKERKKG